MTVQELINALIALSKEEKENQVRIQIVGHGFDHISFPNELYILSQNQYWNESTGLINQDEYEEHLDHKPNDFYLVKKDYQLMHPKGSLFIASNLLETKKKKSKAELVLGTIAEGNIPHLKLEKE